MEDALCRFHTSTDGSVPGWPRRKMNTKANFLRTELVNKRHIEKESNTETWTPSEMRHEMNSWCDYISHQIDVSMELDANFNFPKIHLMSHWVEQIPQYRALQLYSAERH